MPVWPYGPPLGCRLRLKSTVELCVALGTGVDRNGVVLTSSAIILMDGCASDSPSHSPESFDPGNLISIVYTWNHMTIDKNDFRAQYTHW